MATAGGNFTKYLAKYECKRCDVKWKVRNTSGTPKPCDECKMLIEPYKKVEIKYHVTYICGSCGNTWKSKATEKESKSPSTCKICRYEVNPDEVKLLRLRRMFGEFYCERCNHRWSSGYAWEGKGQQCLTCLDMILPARLRPLRRTRRNIKGEPHKEDLCQRCKELGHNCQNAVQDDDDDDDDQSVRSFSSFTTDNSGGDNDASDITPVASDNEDDHDEMLSAKIGDLKLK